MRMKNRTAWLTAVVALLTWNPGVEAGSSPPTLIRQASFGGSANDVPFQVRVTPDGGLVIGGESSSTNGTRTSPAFGRKDTWIIKCNASGTVLWDRSFGGSGDDQLFALQIVRTNQLLLAGASASAPSGNKTSANYGMRDFWVLLLDSSGQKLWEKSFGGTDDDFATCATETDDGGFVVAGYSLSPASGNKSAPCRGQGDFWVVRLDANGNKLWDQSYGGAEDDCAFSLVALPGGATVVAGNSNSLPGGNKRTPNYGLYDIWLLKLDAYGDVLWERDYGGDSDDGYYQVSLARTPQGDFFLGAESYSGATGNKSTSGFGNEDYWILRVDASGNRLWETNAGGVDSDYLTSLAATADGGCVAAGGSNSGINGNKTARNQGSTDFWLVKLNAQGAREWDKSIGGTDSDALLSLTVAEAADGTLFCCGDSYSGIGGDKSTPCSGGEDFWLVALGSAAAPPTLEMALQGGVPKLILHGAAGVTYLTEASADLRTWSPISTNQLSGATAIIADPGQTGAPRRSYRAKVQN